jgi:hypothetical protein
MTNRHDKRQALLWTRCVQYNDQYPIGSTYNHVGTDLKVRLEFAVIKDTIVGHFTDRHKKEVQFTIERLPNATQEGQS